MSTQRPAARYGETPFRRMALAPALLGAIVLFVGLLILDSDAYLIIRFVVAILALVVGWFAIQGRAWWWLPLLAAIAVLWNPVLPFDWSGPIWIGAHYLAAAVLIVVGVFVKVRTEPPPRR